MFICEPCHNDTDCKSGFVETFMRSRGKCEKCGKTASCLDCQGYKAIPLPPEDQAVVDEYGLFDKLDKREQGILNRILSERTSLRSRVAELEGEIVAYEQDGRIYERERTERETAQAETVRLLKLAAAGRREYASSGAESQHVMTDKQILNAEAQNFESALKIVQGDLSPLYGLLPSWRWEEAGLT